MAATPATPATAPHSSGAAKVNAAAAKAATLVQEYGQVGRTFSGQRFAVPRTLDMFETFLHPRHWGAGELLLVFVNSVTVLTAFMPLPLWYYILAFALWRAAYNVGIGAILHTQSHRMAFSRWLAAMRPEWQRLLVALSSKHLRPQSSRDASSSSSLSPGSAAFHVLPFDFRAWMVFRYISTLILCNDGLSYSVLAFRLFRWPKGAEEGLLWPYAAIAAGVAISWFAYRVKMDAHHRVGDYAWYWGDFFFRMEGELVFDGVFEFFPHPMYTVGYLGYYGLSLMTRSPTLLVVSLIAHTAQILFLYAVEEPHIHRTYGFPPQHLGAGYDDDATAAEGAAPAPADKSTPADSRNGAEAAKSLGRPPPAVAPPATATKEAPDGAREHCAADERGADASVAGSAPEDSAVSSARRSRRRVDELVGVFNFIPLRHADATTVLLLLHTLVLSVFMDLGAWYYTLQLILWRLLQYGGLNVVLYLQSSDGWWTRYFADRGIDAAGAYCEWKRVFNTVATMNHAAFCAYAWRLARPRAGYYGGVLFTLRDAQALASIVGGVVLLAFSAGVLLQVYDSVGVYGWTYGDFFLPTRAPSPHYDGLYRYLDNPDCLLGFAGHYGVALLTRSRACFAIALVSHAVQYAFVHLVEMPHLARTYRGSQRPAAIGVERVVRERVARVVEEVPPLRRAADVLSRVAARLLATLRDSLHANRADLRRRASRARVEILSRREMILCEMRSLRDRLLQQHLALQVRNLRDGALRSLDEELLEAARRAGLLINHMEDELGETADGASATDNAAGGAAATADGARDAAPADSEIEKKVK